MSLLAEMFDFGRYTLRTWVTVALRRVSDPRPILWLAIQFRAVVTNQRYTDTDPFKLVWVDPDEVAWFGPDVPKRWGAVRDGPWDQHSRRFEEKPVYSSMVARFQENVDWEETEKYHRYLTKLENHETTKGMTTEADLRVYYRGIDELYERIAAEGYKTQEKLLRESPGRTFESNNDSLHPLLNELRVSIGRDGSFHKRGAGDHRLSIAKVLGLESIPVLVASRHEEWQALRDEIAVAKRYEDLSDDARVHLDHPDLQDLVPRTWRQRGDSSGQE
ncbi:hypothetical protein [Natrononativus amylolyticus]|uniref:hypothetical protein n=1 Tax=Natrononativus amylolyticus TaxID=2963434 RepID=UPI0020CDCA4E|nr:hypothetical protein [Natrononativus amylolyticus]